METRRGDVIVVLVTRPKTSSEVELMETRCFQLQLR